MVALVNYANHVFRKSQKLNSMTGIKVGQFDQVFSYSPSDIALSLLSKKYNLKALRDLLQWRV